MDQEIQFPLTYSTLLSHLHKSSISHKPAHQKPTCDGLAHQQPTKTWRVIVVWESWRIEWLSRRQRRVDWFSLFPKLLYNIWLLHSEAELCSFDIYRDQHLSLLVIPQTCIGFGMCSQTFSLFSRTFSQECLRCQSCWWQALGTAVLFFRALSTHCAERPSLSSYRYMVYTYAT